MVGSLEFITKSKYYLGVNLDDIVLIWFLILSISFYVNLNKVAAS